MRPQGTALLRRRSALQPEADGSCLHPETVRRILAATDLPPITLRDLRRRSRTEAAASPQ
ncbi:hypothetical protein AB0I69_09345 [Streptomyces sp. NPDC050508]|uniref:hypothetical protein n=1 Tax=Streptomyces sp. NPDC050508 TaxID=3155405 RepID=UPI00342249D5